MNIYTVKAGSWSGEQIEPEYSTNNPIDSLIDGRRVVRGDSLIMPIVSEDTIIPEGTPMVYMLGIEGIDDGIYTLPSRLPTAPNDDFDPGITVRPIKRSWFIKVSSDSLS